MKIKSLIPLITIISLLVEEDETIKVRVIMVSSDDPGDKLEQGDFVIMMNGKRIKGDIPKSISSENRMVMRMDTEGDGERPVIIPELGLFLTNDDDKTGIQRTLEPLLPEEFKKLDLSGFNIFPINNEKPSNAENAKLLIDAVETGSDVTLIFPKLDDNITITLKKPKANGNFTFSTDG